MSTCLFDTVFFHHYAYYLQEGIVRAKLAKILAGYDDVLYERSIATVESIKMVGRVALFSITLCIFIVRCHIAYGVIGTFI